MTWRRGLAVILACALFAAAAELRADDDNPFDGREAGEAFEHGRIASLQSLVAAGVVGPGQVLEVELHDEHGRWVYEVEMLRPGGRIEHVDVDARTLQPLPERASESD